MKSLFVLPIMLFVSTAFARVTDGQVKMEVVGTNIVGRMSPGFHINKEAPAKLVGGGAEQPPIKKEPLEIVFDASTVTLPFKVSFYACDDKNTACEEHSFNYKIDGGKIVAENDTPKSANPVAAQKSSTELVYNDHGFVVDDLEGSLAEAKKEKKLILVDFGAPWCPACVRLETEVFGTKIFKFTTKNVIKLSLNPDIQKNFPITDKYKIIAYPTLLILDAEGRELYRSVDFKPATILSQELSAEFKTKSGVVDNLTKRAEAGDKKAQRQMAMRTYKAYQFEDALKWFEKLGEKNAHYADVEISLASDKDLKDDKVRAEFENLVKKWIALDPKSYTAVKARKAWADAYEDKALPAELSVALAQNIELLKGLAEDPKATHRFFKKWAVAPLAPFEQEEILSNWISSAKALRQDPKEPQERLAASLRKKDLSVARPGEITENMNYFRAADMAREELEWLIKLEAAHPAAYTYPMRLAHYFKRQKDFNKAVSYMQKAIEMGPDLRFFNLKSLAEFQKELKQNKEAKKSVELALAMPEAKLERFKKEVAGLEELKKTL